MKIYKCNLCKFATGDRKEVRKHVRKAHGIKGGPYRRPLSESYVSVEV